jgi:hypothetical protein
MSSTPFTARNVAKYAVKAIIHKKTADAATTIITDHTRFEEDDLVVELSAHTIGWAVSDKLKPYTDRMVDATADKLSSLRRKKEQDDSETTEKS